MVRQTRWGVQRVLAALAVGLLAVGLCADARAQSSAEKVAKLPIRSDGPKSLDPAKGSTTYDNQVVCQIYETLLQYKYLVRPESVTSYEDVSEPLLLAEMPKVSDGADGQQVWKFKLRDDVFFHDDPCFPGGKGRKLVSDDVFYSWRRLADPQYEYENYWLIQDTILGLDEYKEAQSELVKSGKPFDYAAPVAGFRKISDTEFEVILKKPVVRFGWVISMFQTSIVAREAVERYGDTLGKHPVGTGPFILRNEGDWKPGQSMVLHRNPNFRDEFYPSEATPREKEQGLLAAAGQKLPLLDRLELTFYTPDPVMWQDFQDRKIAYVQVPAEYFEKAFVKRTKRLTKEYTDKGIQAEAVPLLDFIFRGFNMEDPILGGYDEKRTKIRQAISLAVDLDEHNDTFYNGINVVYDGPIPPPLDGFPKNGKAPISFRGPNLRKARELLAEAGYPEGRGLPEIEYYTSKGSNQAEQTQAEIRQLARIGIRLNPKMVDFSELIEAINQKKGQMFGFAWGSDYPDPENNLALFYSKNKAPGANHYNYDRPEFDKLYEQIIVMMPGTERTKIIEQMRDMIIADVPFVGSMARTRFYLAHPFLKNFKPSEDFYNWFKYLDVDASAPR
jgi:ABC-type transport system substrate-binding protein